MSAGTVRWPSDHPFVRRGRRLAETATTVAFGDGVGLTLFLGAIAFFLAILRLSPMITDSVLYLQLIETVSQGSLSPGRAGAVTVKPGMYVVDGQVYGRNYGQVVLSVPFLWGYRALGHLIAVKLFVILAWSGLLLVLGRRVGAHLGDATKGTVVGAVAAGAMLFANLWYYHPVGLKSPKLLALQTTTMVAGGLTGVFLYRLFARRYGRTAGVAAGALTVFATPVAFWAVAPKRHALTALFVVIAVYAFARSRSESDSPRVTATGFRAGAYACAGLLAWVQSAEGFTLFLALAVVDVPTAPRNDARTLAVVVGAFLLSLVPFFVTNALISGNPLQPPRLLPVRYTGQPVTEVASAADGAVTGGQTPAGDGSGTESGGSSGLAALLSVVEALLPSRFLSLLDRGFGMYVNGAVIVLTEPVRPFYVFVRWGRHGYDVTGIFFGDGTNLSVVESAPVVAGVAATVLAARGRTAAQKVRALREAVEPTDWFVLALSVLFVVLYINRLPVKIQVTVRYLHPLYPLLVYGLVRQAPIRDLLSEHRSVVLWGYEAGVLLGSPLFFAWLLTGDFGKGDVYQAYGLVALAVAGAFVATVLASAVDDRAKAPAAGCLGLAAAMGTVLLLLLAYVLMHNGFLLFPVLERVTGEIRYLTLKY